MKKTCTNENNRRDPKPAERRSGRNPSRSEERFVGEWEADIRLLSKGRDVAAFSRKVKTNGIKNFTMPMATIVDALRHGYEVRIGDTGWGEALRLYPCLDANYDKMFAAAMTMGDFRNCLDDIKFHMTYRGESCDSEGERERKTQRRQEIREERERENVTPDTVVTCPKCGTEFRVGKVLQ